MRYLWENQDLSPNATLRRLRDSIAARVAVGSLSTATATTPALTGSVSAQSPCAAAHACTSCSPTPRAHDANNRSTALKLACPDSASFTMWMAGDAEHETIDYFERMGFADSPGMRVDVLKASHHGSCNGVDDRYLELVGPSLVVASLAGMNDYDHMHAQAKAAYARHGIPW